MADSLNSYPTPAPILSVLLKGESFLVPEYTKLIVDRKYNDDGSPIRLCAICDVVFIEDNQNELHPNDYLNVCKTHKEYSHKTQPSIIKKQLGIINELPGAFNKCSVCECEMTTEEKETVTENDFIITCNKCRCAKGMFFIHIAKDWVEFKTLYPEAELVSAEQNKKFYDFRVAKGTHLSI